MVTAAEQVRSRVRICRGRCCPLDCRPPPPRSPPAWPACGTSSSSPGDGRSGRAPAVPRHPGERWSSSSPRRSTTTPRPCCATGVPSCSTCSTRTGPAPTTAIRATATMRLTRDPHGGGWLKGRFADAAMYDQIAALIDAKSAPLTADDRRPLENGRPGHGRGLRVGRRPRRTTVAPTTGGRRPEMNVLIRLFDHGEDNRAGPLGATRPADDAGLRPVRPSGAAEPRPRRGPDPLSRASPPAGAGAGRQPMAKPTRRTSSGAIST